MRSRKSNVKFVADGWNTNIRCMHIWQKLISKLPRSVLTVINWYSIRVKWKYTYLNSMRCTSINVRFVKRHLFGQYDFGFVKMLFIQMLFSSQHNIYWIKNSNRCRNTLRQLIRVNGHINVCTVKKHLKRLRFDLDIYSLYIRKSIIWTAERRKQNNCIWINSYSKSNKSKNFVLNEFCWTMFCFC